jgi:hypothetical protein
MTIQFSSFPGARERHLQRQYKNLLFPPERQEFDEQRVSGARYMDEQEVEQFLQKFHLLLDEISHMKENETSEILLDLKSRLDQSYELCSGLAGEHENEKQAIIKLCNVIMNSIRQSAKGDMEADINLKEEQLARNTHFQLLRFPLVADLLRPQSPIIQDELLPTLLSESDNDAMMTAFQLFDKDQQESLCQQGEQLLARLQTQELTQSRKRLSMMQTVLLEH